MLTDLEALRRDHPFAIVIDVIDVDSDWTLAHRYDQLVPVLVGDGEEICHYFLDKTKVREYLGRFR